MPERKNILLRLDPAVHDALARWAADELRSTTAQIEFLLRQGLAQAGRLPREVGGMPRRGRPPKNAASATAEPSDAGGPAGSAASESSADATPPAEPEPGPGPDPEEQPPNPDQPA
jgi:hypothetical protein